MTAARPLRVGVVGLGKAAQLHHLPNLAELDGFELVAICDHSESLAQRIAAQYGLPAAAATTSHERLLNRGLDALVIANRHHAPVLSLALMAGIPALVEKPVCWGLAEAEELLQTQEKSGTPAVVGYQKQFDPAVERVREQDFLAGLTFARIHNFAGGRHRHERLKPVAKPGADRPDGGRGEDASIDALVRDEFGGTDAATGYVRTLAELAIHDINLVHALVGPSEVVAATARQTSVGTAYLITLRLRDANCSLEILPDFATARDWDEQATFYTAEGVVELGFASPFLHNHPTVVHRRGARHLDVYDERTVVSRESPYLRELRHLHEVVTLGVQPRTAVAAAVEDLRTVYAIARALR